MKINDIKKSNEKWINRNTRRPPLTHPWKFAFKIDPTDKNNPKKIRDHK